MPKSIENIQIKVPGKIRTHLSNDNVMKILLSGVLPSFPPSQGDVYMDLIETIVYQQISIKAAKSIFHRITSYFGGSIPAPDELYQVEHSELRGLGLSNQKARYMHNIATFFNERHLVHSEFIEMTDEEIIKLLTEIKGVGIWTAQMILIFSLWRPDVFPSADYGIETAMVSLYGFSSESKKALVNDMITVAANWAPYRTHGSLLLWGWKRAQMNLL